MYAVNVYERSGGRLSEDVWSGWNVPVGRRKHPNGREISVYRAEWGTHFPTRGEVKVILDGEVVLREDYALDLPPLSSAAQHAPVGPGTGMVRLGPMDPAEIPNFAALPSRRWLQVGASSGPYVLQLELAKEAPNDMFRDFATGEYYVYRVSRVVVQALP